MSADIGHARTLPVREVNELRAVMANFATGITVLTTPGEDCHGMTANAFTSVSLEPPLVLCCVAKPARMHSVIVEQGAFAVSVLADHQEDVARYFANRMRPSGLAQFERVDWMPGPYTGAPLLHGALAWLECRVEETFGGGDHSIFLGRVVGSFVGPARNALLHYGGAFRVVAPEPEHQDATCW